MRVAVSPQPRREDAVPAVSPHPGWEAAGKTQMYGDKGKPHSRAWQLRHNAVQDRLAKAIPAHRGTVTINSTIPGTDSQLRTNVVITDEEHKKIVMVDITVPFENRSPAFHAARARKEEKYSPLADTLREQGYEVQIHALMVGALGAWDPRNEPVLWACGVGRRYAKLMHRLMVSDSIRWSRDIYIEQITGHRQYHEERDGAPPQDLPSGPTDPTHHHHDGRSGGHTSGRGGGHSSGRGDC